MEYYLHWVPYIAARDAYPVAQLNADLREFAFPRYTEEDDQPKEPPKPRNPWTVEELLPPFARFDLDGMTIEQARSLVEAFESLPAWAQGCVSIDEARALLPVDDGLDSLVDSGDDLKNREPEQPG